MLGVRKAFREVAKSVREMQQENDQLKDENEKLFALLKHESEQVEKLRELVRHMHECMSNVDADGNHECFVCEYENADCEFVHRMRELGVEETK